MLKEPQAFALICWLLWAGLAVIAVLDTKLWLLAIAMAASIYVLWRLYHRRVKRAGRMAQPEAADSHPRERQLSPLL